MSDRFDPYHTWLGIPKSEQPPSHYRLLCLEVFESSKEVIQNAADRIIAFLRTKTNGPHSVVCQQLMNKVAAATHCLLDDGKRRQYDDSLTDVGSPPIPPPISVPSPRLDSSQVREGEKIYELEKVEISDEATTILASSEDQVVPEIVILESVSEVVLLESAVLEVILVEDCDSGQQENKSTTDEKRNGACDECGQPRVLRECTQLGRWFCTRCMSRIRPDLHASEKQMAHLAKIGVRCQTHPTSQEAKRIADAIMSDAATWYVVRVFKALTGRRTDACGIAWSEVRRLALAVVNEGQERAGRMDDLASDYDETLWEIADRTGQRHDDVVVPMEVNETYEHVARMIRLYWVHRVPELETPF